MRYEVRNFIQHWSKLNGEPCPARRRDHAAVCLNYGGDRPQVFVSGGWSGKKTLKDGWILDMQSGRWREVSTLLTYLCTIYALCDILLAPLY